MKLTIPRADLHVALAQVARIVERRNTVPILANVRLVAAGSTLRLSGTDLDAEIEVRTEADVTEPGETTTPAGLLAGLVAKFDGPVRLETSADGATVSVASGRTRARLQVLPASDFPDLSAGDLPHVFTLGAADLADAIDAVTFAISTDETRYYLNGVHLATDADRLVVVATDGHRLARWRGRLPDGAVGMPGVIVPRKTACEIAKIAREGAKAGADGATVSLSAAKIRVEIGSTILTSKLIDGTFPDYARVIPSANDHAFVVPVATMAAAIDRVRCIASDRGRAIRHGFDGTRLTLSAVAAESGSAEEEIEIDGRGAVEIGFNARYVADALASIGSERMTIRLCDPARPAVIEPTDPPADGSERLIVLMPMRV